jgi:hypothetical protein
MGVDGVVVAVLVVADLVDVFPLTKCLNVGVGIGVGAVVAQDGGVALPALVVAVRVGRGLALVEVGQGWVLA